MRRGMITGAASPKCTNLGSMLIARGALSEEQLKSAAELQRANSPDRLLGSILVEKGLVEKEKLEEVLVGQIKGALLEMVAWTSGRFAFEPDRRNQTGDSSEINVELDTQEVLLDVLRELDEQNR
jgi:hypothetical protein